MHASLNLTHYDLITPDGVIKKIKLLDSKTAQATVVIEEISPNFIGFEIDKQLVFFNLKSTLAQLGLDAIGEEYHIDSKKQRAEIKIKVHAIGPIAEKMLSLLPVGARLGKLFAADDRRRVRDPFYLSRMLSRADFWGRPLLSLGGLHGSQDLILEKIDGRTVAYLSLKEGCVSYDPSIEGFLPTIAKALQADLSIREMIRLNQNWIQKPLPTDNQENILLVRTLPLHIRTVFGKVVDELLPEGYRHTTASILDPHTKGSGDIYELYGKSTHEMSDIPLEFYTLEPYREYVFFSDRDQLQSCIEDPDALFKAFSTAPEPSEFRAAVFVVKGEQMLNLSSKDWVARETRFQDLPGFAHGPRQAAMIQRYIEQQPSFTILKAISDELITSQGILLTRFFPSPLMKRMLLNGQVRRCLHGIYFEHPSRHYDDFFSAEDRALLHDLHKFAIPVYWVDASTKQILQYVEKPDYDNGLFIPIDKVDKFLKSTVLGIYGSNLLEGDFGRELTHLLQGILDLRHEMTHPLLQPGTPLSLVTGGGPGIMEMGNRIAQELGILSCANIVDFRMKDGVVNEQRQNPYIDAKMTYRLDKLVERQAEFNLDLPIFLTGGIGTDFEYALEEVRRKVGTAEATPIMLFGSPDYWREKVSHRFRKNLETKTIKGSEWISNCFYCIQTAEEGLAVYRAYFSNELHIGKGGPIYEDGFCVVATDL